MKIIAIAAFVCVVLAPVPADAHTVPKRQAVKAMNVWSKHHHYPRGGVRSPSCDVRATGWKTIKGRGPYVDPTPFVPDPSNDDDFAPLYSREQRPDLYHVVVNVQITYLHRKIGGTATDPYPGFGYVHRNDGFWYLDTAPTGYSLHPDPNYPDGSRDYYFLDDPRAAMEAGLPVGEWAYVSFLPGEFSIPPDEFYTYFDPTPPGFDTNNKDDHKPSWWRVSDRTIITHRHKWRCEYQWLVYRTYDDVLTCEYLVFICHIDRYANERYCYIDLMARSTSGRWKVRAVRRSFECYDTRDQ